jgi:hypothetical protein
MKTRAIALAAFAILTLGAVAAPALPIDKALAIAQRDLLDRGLAGRIHITSIGLETGSVFGGKKVWVATWSEPIRRDDRKSETGIQVNMDGSAARLVKAPASAPGRDTRRPSILDLKH